MASTGKLILRLLLLEDADQPVMFSDRESTHLRTDTDKLAGEIIYVASDTIQTSIAANRP